MSHRGDVQLLRRPLLDVGRDGVRDSTTIECYLSHSPGSEFRPFHVEGYVCFLLAVIGQPKRTSVRWSDTASPEGGYAAASPSHGRVNLYYRGKP